MKFKLKLIALWASLLLLSGCKTAPVYNRIRNLCRCLQ